VTTENTALLSRIGQGQERITDHPKSLFRAIRWMQGFVRIWVAGVILGSLDHRSGLRASDPVSRRADRPPALAARHLRPNTGIKLF
jgi:hypothetical protein